MSDCTNPHCVDGWVARDNLEPAPCRVCRVRLPEPPPTGEDTFTSTVDGAAAHARSMHRDPFGRYY